MPQLLQQVTIAVERQRNTHFIAVVLVVHGVLDILVGAQEGACVFPVTSANTTITQLHQSTGSEWVVSTYECDCVSGRVTVSRVKNLDGVDSTIACRSNAGDASIDTLDRTISRFQIQPGDDVVMNRNFDRRIVSNARVNGAQAYDRSNNDVTNIEGVGKWRIICRTDSGV
jgi:hypothetical protein